MKSFFSFSTQLSQGDKGSRGSSQTFSVSVNTKLVNIINNMTSESVCFRDTQVPVLLQTKTNLRLLKATMKGYEQNSAQLF